MNAPIPPAPLTVPVARRLIARRARALAILRRRPTVEAAPDVRIFIEEAERGAWAARVVARVGDETLVGEKATHDDPSQSVLALATHMAGILEAAGAALREALAPDEDTLPPEAPAPATARRRGRAPRAAPGDGGQAQPSLGLAASLEGA